MNKLELIESIIEELERLNENIFGYNDGRGDLLADIDRGLGSPIKKAKDKFVAKTFKARAPKEVKEAPKSPEIRNHGVSMNAPQDPSIGSNHIVRDAYKHAEG